MMAQLLGFLLGSFLVGTLGLVITNDTSLRLSGESPKTRLLPQLDTEQLNQERVWNTPCNKDKNYYIMGARGTWFQSYVACGRQNKKLATVNCQEESDALRELMILQGYQANQANYPGFWVSGTRMNPEKNTSKWTWMTSLSDFQYFNWAPGEPNNLNGVEYCLELWLLPGNDLKWNDMDCYHLNQLYICEDP